MYTIIDGRKTAADIRKEIAEEVLKLKDEGKKIPHLAAILVGNDPSSVTYVANKIKDCEEVGFLSTLVRYEENIPEVVLLEKIVALNKDNDIDAFIVQLPLPDHISENRVIESINPNKDADGFHPVNLGRMIIGLPGFVPATPFGIVELIKRYGIETSGRKLHCAWTKQYCRPPGKHPSFTERNGCDSNRCPQPHKEFAGSDKRI
jgi:methylenetetrahydrofolate dehydrogenase (NADP+)/methenyltetrahydrofolate cyclohydrolase